MYRSDLDEEVINELNPLIETEFFYEDEWGIWTSSKYLSFNFKRVQEGEEILQLAATIQDVTEKVLLKKKNARLMMLPYGKGSKMSCPGGIL